MVRNSQIAQEAGDRGLDAFYDAERAMLNAPGTVDLDAVEDLLSGRRPAEHNDEDDEDEGGHDDGMPRTIE